MCSGEYRLPLKLTGFILRIEWVSSDQSENRVFSNIYAKIFTSLKIKKATFKKIALVFMLREPDSNQRPLGYEPNELTTAPPRDVEYKDNIYMYYNKHK